MKKITLFLLSTFSFVWLWSQQSDFRYIGGGNDITALTKTSTDLWIGTPGGVCKMNLQSYEKEYFSPENGLWGNYVQSLESDDKGRVWVGTEQGLCRYDQGEWEVLLQTSEAIGYRQVSSIVKGQDGDTWIAFGQDLYRVDAQDSLSLVHSSGEAPDIGTILDVHFHEGLLLLNTQRNGLFSMDREGNIEFLYGGKQNISDMKTGPDGKLWLGFYYGTGTGTHHAGPLVSYDGFEWVVYSEAVIGAEGVARLEIDCFGNLWLGTTKKGIKYWSPITGEDLTITRDFERMPRNHISSLLLDDQSGKLWIGTTRIIFSGHKGKIDDPGLYEVPSLKYADSRGHWIGQSLYGRDNLQEVYTGTDGHVWITQYRALFHFHEGDWTVHDVPLLSKVAVNQDNSIWIAPGHSGGFGKITGEDYQQAVFEDSLGVQHISPLEIEAIASDAEGGLYVLDETLDLYFYEVQNNTGAVITGDYQFLRAFGGDHGAHPHIQLLVSSDEKIWLSINDELHHFNGSNWQSIFFPSPQYCSELALDDQNNVYGRIQINHLTLSIFRTNSTLFPEYEVESSISCKSRYVPMNKAFDIEGDTIWDTSQDGLVKRIWQSDCEVIPFQEPTSVQFNLNDDIAIDSKGNKWLLGRSNNEPIIRIYKAGGVEDIAIKNLPSQIYSAIVGDFSCEMHTEPLSWNFGPNPVQTRLILGLTLTERQACVFKLYDLNGRWIMDLWEAELDAGDHRTEMNLTGLNQGLYLIRAEIGESHSVRKMYKWTR